MKHILLALVVVYQKLTFFLPHVCIYTPTCSNYMIIAIKKWGAFKGTALGIRRIFRCVPWAKGGIDPVPDNPKGDMRWLM